MGAIGIGTCSNEKLGFSWLRIGHSGSHLHLPPACRDVEPAAYPDFPKDTLKQDSVAGHKFDVQVKGYTVSPTHSTSLVLVCKLCPY